MGIRQKLLDTPADRVTPELAQTVTEFCEPIRAIRAAYVGLIEITRDFDFPEQHLGVGFELSDPADSQSGDEELHLVANRFFDSMPEELQEGGCNFLEAEGTAAWQLKAQRVFARP